MNKINDVTEAWGQYVLARQYLMEHAPHMLTPLEVPATVTKPVETPLESMYKDVASLMAMKGKLEWVIDQEEDREAELLIAENDLSGGARHASIAERLEALECDHREHERDIRVLKQKQEGMNNQLSRFTVKLPALEKSVFELVQAKEAKEAQDAADLEAVKEWKPTQEEVDRLAKQFQEYDPLGGWVATMRDKVAQVAPSEEEVQNLASKVKAYVDGLPETGELRKMVSKELKEVSDLAAQLNIDIRSQLGSILDNASKAVAPKKPRAPRKPRSTDDKPTS